MNDLVEIGIYAPAPTGNAQNEPLYLQMHSISSGRQSITLTVPSKPAWVGINPNHLLDWIEFGDADISQR